MALMVIGSSIATYRYTTNKFAKYESARIQLALNLQYEFCLDSRVRLEKRNKDFAVLVRVLHLQPDSLSQLDLPGCIRPVGYHPTPNLNRP